MLATLIAAVSLTGLQEGPVTGPLPDFKVQTLDGKEVQARQALQGSASLVVLWGPWSPQSARALDTAQKMRDKYGAQLKVIALTCWDTLQNTTVFFQENPAIRLTTWWDPAGKATGDSIAMKVFRVRRFPSAFIVDKQLRVVTSFIPLKPSDDLAPAIEHAL